MKLEEAHEKSQPGDRLKHMEYGIVIPRLEEQLETIFQMNSVQFLRTHDDNWEIISPKGTAK